MNIKDKTIFFSKDFLTKSSILAGSIFPVFYFSILFVCSFYFMIGQILKPYYLFIAIGVTIIWLWWGVRLYFERDKKYQLAVFVILLLFSIIVFLGLGNYCGKHYDLSPDSQSVYQLTIEKIAKGWNPFTGACPKNLGDIDMVSNSYTKGGFIPAALLYALTNNIELGKVFNFMLMLSSFFIAFACFLNFPKFKKFTSIILSFLISASPVVVLQSLSYYVDGKLSSILLIFISLSLLLFNRKDYFLLSLFFCVIVIGVNLKLLTAFGYLLIFFLGVSFFFIFFKKSLKAVFITGIISFLFGVIFIGYNPYVTNTIKHRNPFYPSIPSIYHLKNMVRADQKTLCDRGQKPANFFNGDGTEISRFRKLFISIFSESIVYEEGKTSYKIPFTFLKREHYNFGFPDIRIGGFGPLFGGIIILSLFIMLSALIMDFKKTCIVLAISFWIMLTIILNPESWMARYVPQLWFIPFVPIILTIYVQNKREKITNFLSYMLIVALTVNIIMIANKYFPYQNMRNLELKKQLRELAAYGLVYTNLDFRGNRIRLHDYKIKYTEKPFPAGYSKCFNLINSETKVCLGNEKEKK